MSNEVAEYASRAKARWKDQIEQSLGRGDFAKAKNLAENALADLPNDPELLALEEQAIQGRERRAQAHQWMEEGQQLCVEQNFEEGVQVLRTAYAIDERNSVIRSALVDSLLNQALTVLQSDLPSAETLTQEAIELDPGNPVAKSVRQTILEEKQSSLTGKNHSATPKKILDEAPGKAVGPSISQPGVATAKATPPEPKSQIRPPVAAMPIKAVGPSIAQPGVATAKATPPKPKTEIQPQVAETPIKPVGPSIAQPGVATAKATPPEPKTEIQPPVAETPGKAVEPSNAEPKAAIGKATPPEAKTQVQPHASLDSETPHQLRPAVPAPTSTGPRITGVPLWAWAVGGLAVLAIFGVLIRNVTHPIHPRVVPILVEIRTSPPGAKVRLNGESHDIGGQVSLSPGNYRIEALLDGYQPAVQDVNITPQFRGPIELTLLPAMQALRLSTDLESGSVLLDNQPLGVLQDGQFAIDNLKPGKHTLKVTSGHSAEAVVPFEAAAAGPPVLSGSLSAKNLRVILVSNYQTRGQVYCNFGPVLLTLDGQPAGIVPQAGGLDLVGLKAGSHQLVLGEGKEQRKISAGVNPAGGLFVSASSDRNVGTLEIVTHEDGFQVFLNGKPRKVTKQRGHYYIYNVDANPTSIQIAKTGFQSEPPEQKIAVRKGETFSVPFKLTPIPTTASLHVLGALPGTRMSVDGASYDLQPDGSLTATVSVGEHSIELRRQGYKPKSLKVPFKAGQTVNLSGNDAIVDAVATGKLAITARNPGAARVVLRRSDGTDVPIQDREAEEPEGNYTLIATAPGYRDLSEPVRIADGVPASVEVKLVPLPKIVQIMHMEGWEDPGAWKLQNGWYARKGGMFVLFKASSSAGRFQFTARHESRQLPMFRSGRIQWVVNYLDAKNYDLYQLDKEKLSWKRFVNGKPGPEMREPHRINIKDETYPLLLDISSGQVIQKVYDGQNWKALPQLGEGGTNRIEGRFGFFLPGNEEMWLTNFEFTPRE